MTRLSKVLACAAIGLGIAYLVGWQTLRDQPAPFVEWDISEQPTTRKIYDFAHSIQLPVQVPKPAPFTFCKTKFLGLCLQMASMEEYFNHLCTTEAGEYIFKTVDKVAGIHQIVPRFPTDLKLLGDHYKIEDPWNERVSGFKVMGSQFNQDEFGLLFVQPPYGSYDYFDGYYSGWGKLILNHYFRDPAADPEKKKRIHTTANGPRDYDWVLAYKPIEKSEAQYGYVTRGIRRDRDREFRVAGTELIVLDRSTNEVLAVKRDFALAGRNAMLELNWEASRVCTPRPTDKRYPSRFIEAVLRPLNSRN